MPDFGSMAEILLSKEKPTSLKVSMRMAELVALGLYVTTLAPTNEAAIGAGIIYTLRCIPDLFKLVLNSQGKGKTVDLSRILESSRTPETQSENKEQAAAAAGTWTAEQQITEVSTRLDAMAREQGKPLPMTDQSKTSRRFQEMLEKEQSAGGIRGRVAKTRAENP